MNVRRRIRSMIAVLCAVVFSLVAACSASQPPAATTPPVTSSPVITTPTSSSSASPSSTPSAPAAALDAATIAWFKSFCTEFMGLAGMDPTTAVGATGETPQQKQAKKVAEYETANAAITSVATKLGSVPAPGIPNGAALAAAVVDGLKQFAKVVGDAGAGLKSAAVTDEASFLAAEEAARQQVSAVEQVIQTQVIGALAPAQPYLEGNAAALPECAALAG